VAKEAGMRAWVGILSGILTGILLAAWSSVTAGAAPQGGVRTVAPPSQAGTLREFTKQYCITCHNARLKTGGLVLESRDFDHPAADADVWEKVIRKVQVGMMPPGGAPQPDPATRRALVTTLSGALDEAAKANPNPGRPALHRLNRTEYAYAIHDLLDLEVDPATLLPPDDSAYGFDNVADVLGVNATLMEQYVSAAGKVSSLAVGDPDVSPAAEVYTIPQDASQDRHVEGLPFGTIGGILATQTIQIAGEYELSAKFFRTNLGVLRGLEYEHVLEYAVDGVRVHLTKLGGPDDWAANLENNTLIADQIEERAKVRVPLTAGPHEITAAWIKKSDAVDPVRTTRPVRSSHDTRDPLGIPHLSTFTVAGPFKPSGSGDMPSRRRIFTCKPATGAEERCARQIIATLVRRAYRGQGTDADIERLMGFFRAGRQQRDFERGIQVALQRVLASPKFVFRAEREPDQLAAGRAYVLSDLELASRLSFFLWSSIPDDELLKVAAESRLREPAALERQVRRMLADPKSERFVTNFAGQWLYLRNLTNHQPNSMMFPDFDDQLRQAFRREAELFFDSIVHEDRNVLDLMTADYTFVNERLARHYDIPNVYGSQFRRVTLTDDARKGLLGKGAILTVTSRATRTSPVVRGKWILDNILNAPPPPPLANVPPLPEPDESGQVLSMRERMEAHRKNPVCANCHRMFDPIGLAMENFDAVGRWRARDGGSLGVAIDATGELLDGTKVDGVVSLRRALLRQPEMFVGTVVEKLMTYALGRGVAADDMPSVRAIVRDTSGRDYRFQSLVLGIVKSAPFTMRIKASTSAEATADRSPERETPLTSVAAR
jgi:mono/diheme cytochrome c family protein